MLDLGASALASIKRARFIRPSAGEHLLITHSKGEKTHLHSALGEAHLTDDVCVFLGVQERNNLCSLNGRCTGGKPLCVQITMV